MHLKYLSFLGLSALLIGTGCKKDAEGDKLSLNNKTAAYTGYTDIVHSTDVNPSVLEPIGGAPSTITFDTHQAWFDFTKISTTTKGKASAKEGWNLGFWNGTGLDRVIQNYAVTSQAVLLSGRTSLAGIGSQTQLKAAYDSINGGTFGMGPVQTFDFHRDGQFVIGTPNATNKVYLMKVPPIVVHPDTLGGAPVNASYYMVAVNISSGTYNVAYRPLTEAGDGTGWDFLQPEVSIPVTKSSSYQYSFVSFNTGTTVTIQPTSNLWNLGLSAVTLKRFVNPAAGGGAYAFAVKGVVLNNNSNVEVYRVQSTASNAGAPGPYDPNYGNYTASNDPALNPSNSIEARFLAYKVDSIQSSLFSKTSQEEIGQYYRRLDLGNYQLFVDRFYVIKLANGDIYKLKFDNLSSTSSSNPVNNGVKIRFSKIAVTP